MDRRKNVVIGLEVEFRKALEGLANLTEFTQEIGKLLSLMGFSDFSVLSWSSSSGCNRNSPKPLIKNSSEKTLNQAIYNLVNRVVAQPDKEVLQAAFEETDSLIDSSKSSVRRSSYRLTTRSGNYAYFIRKGSQTPNYQQVLCIVDISDNADQFREHVAQRQMALDSLNKVIEEIGVDRFPSLFAVAESVKKINIGSKPLRLLNIIALNNVTLSQAAAILDISVDTANKHIAKIKSELGVSTLPSAVFYAANKGLINRVI